MSTNRDRIIDVLEQSPNDLCDDCLSRLAAVVPRQTVNQICRPLAAQGLIERARRSCGQCHSDKLVNKLKSRRTFLETHGAAAARAPSPDLAVQRKDTAAHLDQLRRRMVAILNSVAGPSDRGEGFSARVSRLRDENKLPSIIASMMLTLNGLRNAVVYEGSALGRHESTVVDAAWSAIEHWWESQPKLRNV